MIKLILFLSSSIFIYFFSLTAIYAQTVTNIPVTTVQETPAAASPIPSTTLGRKAPPGLNKNKTKKEIAQGISLRASNMINRANAALSRLDSIWARVLSRIEKFKASGKDVSGLSGWIQQVEFKKQAAADSIASASATAGKIDKTTTPKTAVKSFVNNFKNLKKALKEYHQAILTVIRNIKGMSGNTGIGPSVIPSATKIPTPTITGILSPTPTSVPPTATVGPT